MLGPSFVYLEVIVIDHKFDFFHIFCAVISIGTATLAAFIGAGGLGEPIVVGLSLNDTDMILRGAVPAALLAVVVELSFGALERKISPPK